MRHAGDYDSLYANYMQVNQYHAEGMQDIRSASTTKKQPEQLSLRYSMS